MRGEEQLDEFYTPEELAERWKVSEKTVRRLIETGQLVAVEMAIPGDRLTRSNPRIPGQSVLEFEQRSGA